MKSHGQTTVRDEQVDRRTSIAFPKCNGLKTLESLSDHEGPVRRWCSAVMVGQYVMVPGGAQLC